MINITDFNQDDWNEWKKLVIYRLDEISNRIYKVECDLINLKLNFAKSGGLAGIVASSFIIILYELIKLLTK